MEPTIIIIKDDITTVHADAVVNAANKTLMGGGGVDGAIHKAAGPQLLKECRNLSGCEVGEAKLTKGYNLPADYVIHTVGPVWNGGNDHEATLLAKCYFSALEIAVEKELNSIAFPSISTGAYGYPIAQAADVAMDAIASFMQAQTSMFPHTVIICCFSESDKVAYQEAYRKIIDQDHI